AGDGGERANRWPDVRRPGPLGAQNKKPILGVVVGYSLDEARQHFLGRWFWLWTHADYPGPDRAHRKRRRRAALEFRRGRVSDICSHTAAPCKSFGNRRRSAHKAWSSSKSMPVRRRLLDSCWTPTDNLVISI